MGQGFVYHLKWVSVSMSSEGRDMSVRILAATNKGHGSYGDCEDVFQRPVQLYT